MQDDVFEDAIVDFFEMADIDKDGILDYSDFYSVRIIWAAKLVHMCNYTHTLMKCTHATQPRGVLDQVHMCN